MRISSEDMLHTIEDFFEKVLYRSRWVLFPMYLILIVVVFLILIKFCMDVWDFVMVMSTLDTNDWIIRVLELLDLTLVANLVLIVAFSGYENFISKIDYADDHVDRPSWMGNLDFSGLKLKIIGSVVAISLIELLQDFLNISAYSNHEVMFWRVVLHLTFVLTGFVFAAMEILAEKRHEIKNKEELVQMEKDQFADL